MPMLRMMTYRQANQILEPDSLLSPNNRCICKITALNNHAQSAPLAPFSNNRLVPVKTASIPYGVIKKYHIIYKNESGTILSSEWREPGEQLNPPAFPSKPGYKADSPAWGPNYTGVATGDAVYTPRYVRDTVNLTFISEGQPYGNYSGTYTVGSSLSIPNPTSSDPDMIFNGWSPAWSGIVPDHDQTYTAQWTSRYTIVSGLGHGIHDGAEEGEPIQEVTRQFVLHPNDNISGAKTVTIYVYGGLEYTNTENDSVNKTYTLDPNPKSFTGTITVKNWGNTSRAGMSGGYNGGRWSITFSESLANMGWAPEFWYTEGDRDLLRILENSDPSDKSVTYQLRSQKGPGYDDDASDLSDSRYEQKIDICVNKNGVDEDGNQINPGKYYVFNVKIDPKYSATSDYAANNNTTTSALSFNRRLNIDLAS